MATMTTIRTTQQGKPQAGGKNAIRPFTVNVPETELTELRQRAPNVLPEIIVMTHAQLNQALRERRVQIAIRGQYRKVYGFEGDVGGAE